MNFNKTFLVAGTGKSGISAAKLLLSQGAKILLFDDNRECDTKKVKEQLELDNVNIILGKINDETLDNVDCMIISPGIPLNSYIAETVKAKNIPIWSEIELAYQTGKGKIAAITGTNGKTTTTSLVGEIAKAYHDNTFVVGNIGIPYTEVAKDTNEASIIVAEISSFQLEAIIDFKPKISAVLNIEPDHLNRHGTMENYASIKLDIAKNQDTGDILILNYDDEIVKNMALRKNIKAKICYFSRKHTLDTGVYLEEDKIVLKTKEEKKMLIRLSALKIVGDHNVENVMAAIAIAYYLGIPMDVIHKACESFQGVEHRIEYVGEVNGVVYYNDSKATNPSAAIKGIQAMQKSTLLIGGGSDKDVSFDEWIKAFAGKVKYLVLLGETAEQIAETAKTNGFFDIIYANSLEEAVDICKKEATAGEAVLLSPACASYDMFTNYEERGNLFKECIRK